jgi:hypothetical protein
MSETYRLRREQRFANRFWSMLFRLGLGLIILLLGWIALMVVLQGLDQWKWNQF